MTDLPGPWVCSIDGSARISPKTIQASLGDPRHPLGFCYQCRPAALDQKDSKRPGRRLPKHTLSPLCRPAEWQGRPQKPVELPPEDLFGALPEDERKALSTPIRLGANPPMRRRSR